MEPVNTTAAPSCHKLIHIEILRILAIFFVLFIHTGNSGFTLYAVQESTVSTALCLSMAMIAKTAVPLFFMISGALLLGKDETVAQLYKKRVLRFALSLLAVSACYFVRNWLVWQAYSGPRDFLVAVYNGSIADPLWYLYSYLALLVMLPLLRKLVRGMDKKDYVYFSCIFLLLTGILPMAQYYVGKGHLNLSGSFNPVLLTNFNIFMFIMGYFMERVLDPSAYTRKNLLLLTGLGILSIVATVYMTLFRAGIEGASGSGISLDFLNCLIPLPTFVIYGLVKFAFMHNSLSPRAQKVISHIGSTTFGIYLLEGFLRPATSFVLDFFAPILPAPVPALLWIATAVLVGIGAVSILKKIPGIRYLL